MDFPAPAARTAPAHEPDRPSEDEGGGENRFHVRMFALIMLVLFPHV